MKKILKIFTIVFLFSFFILPKLSWADALVTPLSITETSVTLRAENLTPNTSVILSVVNKNSASTPYSVFLQTTSNNIGKAFADFSGLSPGEEYIGSVYYEGEDQPIGTTIPPFLTLAGMSVQVKYIKDNDTAVDFLLSGFPYNQEISFNVENYDYSTPTYTKPQDVMIDDSGTALLHYYGLSPGGRYRYSHSEEPGFSGSFWTTGTAPEGDEGGNGGGGGPGSSSPNGLVPCGTIKNPTMCGFNDILTLINTVINYLLFVLALPIAAIMFAYAGFMLVFSGGASEKRSKAKSIFINVAIGVIIVAAAWLAIHTLSEIVGYDGSWIGL